MQLANMSPEKQAATEARHTRMITEKYEFEEFKKAEKQAADDKKAADKAAKAAGKGPKPKRSSRPKPGLSQATLLAQQTQAEQTQAEPTEAEMALAAAEQEVTEAEAAIVEQRRIEDDDMVRVISHGCLFRLKPSAIQNEIRKVKMKIENLK